MKKINKGAAVLALGCLVAVTMSSCHSGDGEVNIINQTVINQRAVTNSLKGIILDQDGAPVYGAVVKINNKDYSPVSGSNEFEAAALSDGTYAIQVTKASYSEGATTVSLKSTTKTVDGAAALVGENKEVTIYLIREVTSEPVKLGASGETETISIETSTQDDGTGNIVGNTQDPTDQTLDSEVTVTVETPGLNAENLTAAQSQLNNSGASVADFEMRLTNLTSIAVQKTRAITVIGESFGSDKYSFFTGVQLTTNAVLDFTKISADLYSPISIKVPDANTKNAVKLYRRKAVTDNWKEVTASTVGDGIKNVDFTSKDNEIIVNLNVLETQQLALGLLIDKEDLDGEILPINEGPLVNSQNTTQSIKTMDYSILSGVVIDNVVSTFLVDYLRKVVLRHLALRAVYEASQVNRTYEFSPLYQLPSKGELYLTGYQKVDNMVFSVVNGSASFKATIYGDAVLYPYHIAPVEVTPTHIGGGND